MASSKAATGTTTFKAGISAGILTLINYYQAGKLNKEAALKRVGYQLVGSLAADNLETIVRGFLPLDSKISSMYLHPMLTGGTYTLLTYFVDGDKNYIANFLISAGSEIASTYVEPIISNGLSTSTSQTSTSQTSTTGTYGRPQ